MLRQYRLKSERAFDYVYRKGEKSSDKCLVLLCAKSREGLKVGLSVSKKVGNAVMRNKVKRRLREQITPLIPALNPNFLYVVAARPQAAEADFVELGVELKRILTLQGKLDESLIP